MNKHYIVCLNKQLTPMFGTVYSANGAVVFYPVSGDPLSLASEDHAVEITEEQAAQLEKATGGVVEKTRSRIEKIKDGFIK